MDCWLSGFETSELTTNATCNLKNGPCQSCTAVAKVNKEINQALTTLRHLLTKRCDLHSEQNRTHDLVHRLPVELKNHIFELLLPRRDEWGKRIGTGSGVLPSYLASICRGWRDIARSNPFLWTKIHIAIRTPNSTSSRTNFVHDWILRSQTLPLTFYIHVNRTRESVEWLKQVLAPVLDAMSQCCDRLQSLSFHIPYPILGAFQHSDFQWHRLTQLRLSSLTEIKSSQSLPFLNPTASPEKIELHSESLKSLQISWNHLTSAYIEDCDLEDIANLFQHASQLTDCQILSLDFAKNYSMPAITHHRLKSLCLHDLEEWGVGPIFLGSLTLPCLQEFDTDETVLLTDLSALVHRSSCPLTRLTLACFEDEDNMEPDDFSLPGVTGITLESLYQGSTMIKKLLLEKYFPNLRHLTLRLQPFLTLWHAGIISLLLDRKRPRLDGPNEGIFGKILVVDEGKASRFTVMWNSDVGEQLKALDIGLREDGFEFL